MQKLIALTALYILGQWLQPGAEVPGDVPGFDYAKAARKGMLEAEDGSEVENPLPPGQAAPASPEPDSQFVTQSLELLRKHDELQGELNTAREQLAAYRDGEVAAQQTREGLQAQLDQATSALGEAQAKIAGLDARPPLPDDALARINAVKGVGDTLATTILTALTKAD